MSGYSIQEVINRNEQDVEREAGRTLSDKDLLMEELRNLQEGRTLSDRDMVPRMQGGGPTLPPAVPAVGGGLPSVADNMRNSMPPARPVGSAPQGGTPMGSTPQGGTPMGSTPQGGAFQNLQQMAGTPPMDPEVELAVNRTIESSEGLDEAVTNAMSSSVVSFAESPEEIINIFDSAKEQALMQYAQITGSPDAGMSDTDARLMELLGGGEEMMAPEEMIMSEEVIV